MAEKTQEHNLNLKGIKLSKDYHRLWALMQKGGRVPAYIFKQILSDGTPLWDVVDVKFVFPEDIESGRYNIGTRGISYTGEYGFNGFLDTCNFYSLHYVAPTRSINVAEDNNKNETELKEWLEAMDISFKSQDNTDKKYWFSNGFWAALRYTYGIPLGDPTKENGFAYISKSFFLRGVSLHKSLKDYFLGIKPLASSDPVFMPRMSVETHELKTWPSYFEAVCSGHKTFEVRKHDRDFQVGDTLNLLEWDNVKNDYTGRAKSFTITYVLTGGQFGVHAGYCILGIKSK